MKRLQTLPVVFCRTILICSFWLAMRLSASLKISGARYNTGAPRTYLGMMHKRDIDPFILIPAIAFQYGWKGLSKEVRFALRGDGFTTGFLSRMVTRPSWLARLFYSISVGPALRWLGTCPLEDLVRPAEEWVREALQTEGDLQAGTILSPVFLRDFAQATRLSLEQAGQLALSQLLAWHYHQALQGFYGPEILLQTRRRRIERRVVARIHQHLDEIVSCFWQDGSFLGSPEGQLSPDGSISPMNAGFHRIVRASPPDLRVIPISLIYDFMTTGRVRIFADFAPAIEYAAKLPRAELDARLRQSWLLHAHFTCTQLASGFLIERQRSSSEFTLDELAQAVYQQACALAAIGRKTDPQLLQSRGVTRRVKRYLAYVERHGLVQRGAARHWKIAFHELAIDVGPREVAYHDTPLLYAYHELQDLLSVS